jgi:hypothetical protein
MDRKVKFRFFQIAKLTLKVFPILEKESYPNEVGGPLSANGREK